MPATNVKGCEDDLPDTPSWSPDSLLATVRSATAILVAILIAFGLDAWWENRTAGRKTEELLAALEAEWVAELSILDGRLQSYRENRAAHQQILRIARSGSGGDVDPDSLDALFQASAWVTYKPTVAALNSLLVGGLENVSDLRLRSWPISGRSSSTTSA